MNLTLRKKLNQKSIINIINFYIDFFSKERKWNYDQFKINQIRNIKNSSELKLTFEF